MSTGVGWVAIMSAIAGPAIVVAVWARQWRRDPEAISTAFLKTQAQHARKFEERPGRWYHAVAPAFLLGLPITQWFAYLHYRTPLVFFVPLAVTAGVLMCMGMFRPRAVFLEPPNHREWAINGALLAAGVAVAFAMPLTGSALVLRGTLLDILALAIVSYVIRVWHSRKRQSEPS